MSSSRWQRVKSVYTAAIELPIERRGEFLSAECAGDERLREEVELMMASDPTLLEPTHAVTYQARDSDSTDSSSSSSLSEGMKVGPYRVLNKIGEGGMGVVYHALDERLNRFVALKTLRGSAVDEAGERRLWREARVAASLNHPGVCRLYDVGESRGRIYLVMELLEGEPLARAISRGAMDVPQAIDTMLGVLEALEGLHQKELIHRDLKPSNIFLTPHGVKLLDFGLAQAATRLAAAGDSITGQFAPEAGTPYYLSPEQLEGHEPDARSDVFAAGSVFFELLTGRRAFAGRDTVAIFHAILSEKPPAIQDFRAKPVEGIVHKALARNPHERYPSARAMAEDLRAARLGGRSAPAQPKLKRLIALPFRMLRPDAEFDFLSFSLPDAITNSLSALSALVVRSSAAAARYAGHPTDLRAVAAETDVDYLLTGTMLRSGDQLRVATQLAEGSSGAIIWSQTSELSIQDIFQLQDELVRRVVDSLALPLTGRDNWLLTHDVPASPLAYEYYLRANQLSTDWRHYLTARGLYQKCLEIDPHYAPAWARLGRCHRAIAKNGGDPDDLSRAESAFRRALDLNPELNLAHGYYAYLEADSARAQQAMARLLGRAANNTNDPNLYAGLVYACRFCGLLDASLAAHKKARALDPLMPTSVVSTWFMAGNYLAVHENSAGDSISDAHALMALGRDAEALDLARRDEQTLGELLKRESNPQYQFGYWIAVSLRALLEGKREESFAAIDRTMTWRRGEELFHAVRLLARLGEVDRGVAQLARVAEYGFVCYPAMTHDPWLDPLRSHPRFTTILSQIESRHEAARRIYASAGGREILGVLN
jgi:serine/threonine protein kinase